MWNKFVCLLLGHDYAQSSEYYGKLDNGLATYKLVIGNCIRCNKVPSKGKKLDYEKEQTEEH